MGKKLVDLESLNGGAVSELFSEEWQRLMANIADVNTKPDMAREITIRVKVKPDKSRLAAETEVRVTSKLAGLKPHEGAVFFERKDGSIVAYPYDPGQGDLGLEEQPKAAGNVVPIAREG